MELQAIFDALYHMMILLRQPHIDGEAHCSKASSAVAGAYHFCSSLSLSLLFVCIRVEWVLLFCCGAGHGRERSLRATWEGECVRVVGLWAQCPMDPRRQQKSPDIICGPRAHALDYTRNWVLSNCPDIRLPWQAFDIPGRHLTLKADSLPRQTPDTPKSGVLGQSRD